MTLVRRTLAALFFLCFVVPHPSFAGPYIEFGVGVNTRDVVEEGLTPDGEATLFEGVEKGNADSTRAIAEIGWNFGDRVQLYGNVGGIDLKIDEFNEIGRAHV